MAERLFRFKQFSVKHEQSAMKVGVDAVMLGAWVNLEPLNVVLDAGCGCGIISLMLAQRYEDAKIVGIDIDSPSIEEANDNVLNSPWDNRINIVNQDFNKFCFNSKITIDHIVSNPPYFNSGVDAEISARMTARHISNFSPLSLIENGNKILAESGKISMICPPEWFEKIRVSSKLTGMSVSRLTNVRGNHNCDVKRILVELSKEAAKLEISEITIEEERGVPTAEYKELTKDFYLKF